LNWMTEKNFLVTRKRWVDLIQGDRKVTEHFLKHLLFAKKYITLKLEKKQCCIKCW
jgi:hypothetical protein